MIADVAHMERHAFNVFRRASRSSNDTSGTVRVAVTEGPGNFWILPRLIDFQKTYRKITVDLRCAMEQADVARLESDIAIQLEPPTNPDLIVARLGRLHIYPFVSKDYADLYGVCRRCSPEFDEPPHRPAERAAGRRHMAPMPGVPGPGDRWNGDRRRSRPTPRSRRALCGRARRRHRLPRRRCRSRSAHLLVAVDLGVSHHCADLLAQHLHHRRSSAALRACRPGAARLA